MKWEKQEKFSIRKLNVGAASVLIAAGWIFAGQNDIVNANESRVEGIQKSKLETERESKNSQANSYQNNSTETPLGSALNVQNDSTKSPDPIPEGLHTQHTSVFGRGVANAQIKVTFSNGEVLSGTVDSTGHFNIPLSRKLIAREMLQVTQTVPNHATSNPVTVSVGVAYGDIVTLEKPALNQRVPVDNLTDIQPKEVEEIKDLIVQLNPLIERDNIDVARNGTATITFFDDSTAKISGSELVVEKQTSAKPTTNPVDSDDRKITGTGAPGATVTVTVNGQKLTATVQPNGQWEVPLNAPLATGTTVSVTQQAPNQKVSAPETLTVAKSDAEKANDLKAPALAELDKAAEDAKQAIEALPNLSAEEKKAEKAKVDDAAKAAKTKIEQSADATGVTTEVDAGKATIQAVVDGAKAADKANELSKSKADALKALDKATEDAKQAIEALPNLSAEEKAVANQVINQIHNQAKQELEQSSNVADVESLVNASKPVFEELVAEAQKSDASKALDKVAEDAKQAIEALPNLSAEEKKAEQAKVDDAAKAAKTKIEQLADATGVITEVDAGKAAIQAVVDGAKAADKANELAKSKADALKALDKTAEDAKQAIEALPYLSQVDKDKAKVEVDQARDAAKAKVDQATDKAQVPSEVDKGQTAISNLVAAASAKQSAKGDPAIREELPEYQLPSTDEAVKALDQAAEDAKQAIDALPNLSNDEKTAAKQAVDQARVVAKENVSKTATATELAKVTDAGKATIQAVVDGAKATDTANELAKSKADALKALDKVAEDAKKAIEALPNLSKAEKDGLKAQAELTLEKAKNKVEKVADAPGVTTEADAGKASIQAVVDGAKARDKANELAKSKADALKALDKAAADAKQAIDQSQNLSQEDKNKAKAEIDKARDAAKAKVSNSSKIADVTQAVTFARGTNQAIIERVAAIDSANENLRQQNRKDLEKKVVNKLPETGVKENLGFVSLGIIGLILGLAFSLGKREKD